MKKASLIAVCFLLITQIHVHAATVDGFIGLPWGANKSQVTTAMEGRGFKVAPPFDTHFWGEFAGYSGAYLMFSFERNSLYEGAASLCHTKENEGYNSVQSCRQKLESMLRNKYGTPTTQKQDSSISFTTTWEGIKSSKGSDNITIKLWIRYPNKLNGGIVEVSYKNNSLLRRLKQAGKSDI